jgi:hypothetical protein
MRLLERILFGAIAGTLVMAVVGTIFMLLEQRWPIDRGFNAEQKDIFNQCFRRAAGCVWLAVTMIYILVAPN